MPDSYNGWSNYPTWAVNLWLSNDEGLYNSMLALVDEAKDDADSPFRGSVVLSLADRAKEFVEVLLPDLPASFASDLLTWAVGQVDWQEIAEHWVEEAE